VISDGRLTEMQPGSLGGYEGMQYRRTAMQANRRQQATRVLLVLAVLLASVWTASLAAPAGHPTNHLTDSRPLLGIEPAILRDRLPMVRPLVERPGQSGRLVPVLLGMLAAALAVGYRVAARRPRSGLAPARSLIQSTQLEARAPPFLQPA
jgi:hypothetical protein